MTAVSILAWHLNGPVVQQRQNIATPEFIPWVWQRQEDLSFLAPGTKVALWIATVDIGENIRPQLRQNPAILPENAAVIAVIRIEALNESLPAINALAETLMALYLPTGANQLQLDFDATVSQRQYYKALLQALRVRLGATPLSITALASWCMGDPWVDDLPIDYAIPMLYRMGYDTARINQDLATGSHFSARVCSHNAGYSTDEERVPLPGLERIFLFNDKPWTESTYASITEELRTGSGHIPGQTP